MTSWDVKYGTQEVGYLPVSTSKVIKERNKVEVLKLGVYSSTPFELDDTINFYNESTILKFVGTITKITSNASFYSLEVKGLGLNLTTEIFSEVYRNMSPEAIIEDIITNYTSLTFSSTVSSGVTIDKLVFRDELLIDAITKLTELFTGVFHVDKNGLFTLSKKFKETASVGLVSGSDTLKGNWVSDSNKKFTKVIVIGANISQRTTETLTGTGTEFTTSFIPESVEIPGLKQTTDNIDGDYEVDAQNKTITFESSQTNPVVSYTYLSQVKVEIGDGNTLKLQKSYLESTTECLKLALSALDLYSDGIQSSKWLKSDGSDHETVEVGQKISTIDTVNTISGDFVIQKVEYEYPSKLYLTIGEEEDSIYDWQKETQQRIKELESKDQNSEFVTKFNYNRNKINIKVTSRVSKLRTVSKGDAWILDDPVNSQLDAGFKLDGGTITDLV